MILSSRRRRVRRPDRIWWIRPSTKGAPDRRTPRCLQWAPTQPTTLRCSVVSTSWLTYVQALSKNAVYSSGAPKLHDPRLVEGLRLKVTHSLNSSATAATATTTLAAHEEPMDIDDENMGSDGMSIPGDEMIQYAREKREQLRNGIGTVDQKLDKGDEYIPLSSDGAPNNNEMHESESRFVRDDADDADEHFADAVCDQGWWFLLSSVGAGWAEAFIR